MDGRSFILPAIYTTQCEFSSLGGFMKRVGKAFDALPFEKEAVLQGIDRLIENFSIDTNSQPINQHIAENLLIIDELRKIKQNVQVLEQFDPSEVLSTDFTKMKKLFTAEGIETGEADIFQVDKFPPPFDSMDWTYFNADQHDTETYGIPFGIYVKKGAAIPVYMSYVIAHELVHVAIGLKTPKLIARGLEDGIADLFGSLYVFSKLKGKEVTNNLTIYNRLGYPHNPFWDIYLDGLLQVIVLYNKFGLAGIKVLIKEGRDAIKQVEQLMWSGDYDKIKLPKGEWDETLNWITTNIQAFPRHYVVSPLAKYLSNIVRAGVFSKDLFSQNNIDDEAGRMAIKELQEKMFLLILKDNKIVSADLKGIKTTKILRYLVK